MLETKEPKVRGDPVITLVAVSFFVSLATAALSWSYFASGDLITGPPLALVSVLAAIFCSTIVILTAVGNE